MIVDDGSTDNTAEIVEPYTARFPWIELVRRPQHVHRSFAGKVYAFNAGLERVRQLEFEIIGNLDADLSFDPDYLEFLMRKFSQDPNSVSPERHLPKTAVMTRQETALKARTMLRVDASFSDENVLRRSAVMFPIGWGSGLDRGNDRRE